MFFYTVKALLTCVGLLSVCCLFCICTDDTPYDLQGKALTSKQQYDMLNQSIVDESIDAAQLKRIIEQAGLQSLIDSDVMDFNGIYSSPRHPLVIALSDNCTEKVKVLLDYRTKDINCIKSYRSLARMAIDHNNVQVLELLLDKNANADCCDRLNGFSCLMYAVYVENKKVVTYLLNRGVDVNLLSTEVNPEVGAVFTALHIAVWKKNKELYDLLLQFGADESAVPLVDRL